MSPITGVHSWRVYYKGGAVYDSTKTAWTALPRTGVLLVMLYFDPDPKLRRYMSGSDWYFCQPNNGDPILGSLGYDSQRDKNYVETRYPGADVIEGIWTTDAEMRSVIDAAMASVAPET